MPIPRRADDGDGPDYDDDDPRNDPAPPPDDIIVTTGGPQIAEEPAGGGGGGGGGFGAGNGLSARPVFDFPDLPPWNPPEFHAPTFEEAQKEPGYQFRLAAGQQALERSAAARGLLRSGGTLKDAIEYNQNFGSAEYDKVFGRSTQMYDREYRRSYDMYAPQLARYNNLFGAEKAAGLAAYDRDWQSYMFANRGGGGGGMSAEDKAYQDWLDSKPD